MELLTTNEWEVWVETGRDFADLKSPLLNYRYMYQIHASMLKINPH